jgi:hypothetical protein
MPWLERGGERRFFHSNSQGAAWANSGRDPRKAQEGLASGAKEMPPEKALDESPLLGKMRVVNRKNENKNR